jgi:hypothetical protein
MKIRALTTQLQIALLAVLLAASIILGSCTPPSQLPESAFSALNRQWDSLPGSATHDLTVLRSWQGQIPPDADPAPTSPMDVWCVETLLSSNQPYSGESETVIWIITRTSDDATWESAPLMTMSSLWPYQACGVAP